MPSLETLELLYGHLLQKGKIMSKSWDKLREPVSPIKRGNWSTCNGAKIMVYDIKPGLNARLTIDSKCNCFDAGSLRQLAEFCTELADQLDEE